MREFKNYTDKFTNMIQEQVSESNGENAFARPQSNSIITAEAWFERHYEKGKEIPEVIVKNTDPEILNQLLKNYE